VAQETIFQDACSEVVNDGNDTGQLHSMAKAARIIRRMTPSVTRRARKSCRGRTWIIARADRQVPAASSMADENRH
jgi:hypothetical protein